MKSLVSIPLMMLASFACGYTATALYYHSTKTDNTNKALLQEVTLTVFRPAYEDAAMTQEIPLTEIYTPYEMDLFRRVAIAAGYTSEQIESADFDAN